MNEPPASRQRHTLKDVAARAGVSPSLVSLALNGKPGVAARRREEIQAVARSLGYAPDPLARDLRLGTTSMLGLVVRNVANPFFNDLLMGMQDEAFDAGVSILAVDSRYSVEREREHIATLASRRVEGLAIAPVGDARSVHAWQRARPGATTVLINSGFSLDEIPHVSPDDVAAVTLAFEHLAGLGHTRIAFLSAPSPVMADPHRLQAYTAACQRSGLVPLPVFAPLTEVGIQTEVGRVLRTAEPPTAFITNSDFAANHVYGAVRGASLRVGQDVSVVGHDDLATSASLGPPLTTIRVDRRELGKQAFLRLSGVETGDFLGPVSLVLRSSTGPAVLP